MADDERPRVLGEFSSYDDMLAVIRQRVQELSINGERFDEYAGLPRGYLSKLVGANPTRRIGLISLAPLFCALGISGALFENKAATNRLRQRLKPRNNSYPRTTYTLRVVTDRQWSRIQKLGRQARWEKLSKHQRSAIMRAVRAGRKAAAARWRG
jgi:hypothetical protein